MADAEQVVVSRAGDPPAPRRRAGSASLLVDSLRMLATHRIAGIVGGFCALGFLVQVLVAWWMRSPAMLCGSFLFAMLAKNVMSWAALRIPCPRPAAELRPASLFGGAASQRKDTRRERRLASGVGVMLMGFNIWTRMGGSFVAAEVLLCVPEMRRTPGLHWLEWAGLGLGVVGAIMHVVGRWVAVNTNGGGGRRRTARSDAAGVLAWPQPRPSRLTLLSDMLLNDNVLGFPTRRRWLLAVFLAAVAAVWLWSLSAWWR